MYFGNKTFKIVHSNFTFCLIVANLLQILTQTTKAIDSTALKSINN